MNGEQEGTIERKQQKQQGQRAPDRQQSSKCHNGHN